MSGSAVGGRKAAMTNKKRYGKGFDSRIGKLGGSRGHTGGFAAYINCLCDEIPAKHHKAQCAGLKGGRISKRQSQKEVI